jgi:uncharacterized protein (DUF1330 family)
MIAYVIFIKERTRDQREVDLYKEMAPAALAGHPITFHIAHGQKEVVEGQDFEDMMMLEFPTFAEAIPTSPIRTRRQRFSLRKYLICKTPGA